MEQTHPPRRWANVLKHRWPTVLGIAVAALAVFDLQGRCTRACGAQPCSCRWSISAPQP